MTTDASQQQLQRQEVPKDDSAGNGEEPSSLLIPPPSPPQQEEQEEQEEEQVHQTDDSVGGHNEMLSDMGFALPKVSESSISGNTAEVNAQLPTGLASDSPSTQFPRQAVDQVFVTNQFPSQTPVSATCESLNNGSVPVNANGDISKPISSSADDSKEYIMDLSGKAGQQNRVHLGRNTETLIKEIA